MDFDARAFLDEPLRPASVATVSSKGRPALATMWFLFADDLFWFHSPGVRNPFVRAAEHHDLVSTMVETFNPVGRVIQIRATGPASTQPYDSHRVRQIYDRYLSPNDLWSDGWHEQTRDEAYALWAIEPVSGAAVQFPKLKDAGGVFRWNDPGEFRRALEAAAR